MNSFYTVFFESLQKAGINLTSDNLKVYLLSSEYTFNAADTNCTSCSAAALATSGAVSGVTVSGATATFPAIELTGVAADLNVAGIVLFKDGGTPATSVPILYASTATGLPLTTNGQKITVNFGSPSINLNAT